jgi:hypothetical protein
MHALAEAQSTSKRQHSHRAPLRVPRVRRVSPLLLGVAKRTLGTHALILLAYYYLIS